MIHTNIRRMLMAALLLSVVPATGHAQLGGLKKLKDKAAGIAGESDSKSSSNQSAPKQWKAGERVPPLTIEQLDDVIKRWQADLEYMALSEKEKTRRDEEAAAAQAAIDAKKEARDACMKNVAPDDILPLQEKMQARVMELAQAGDANAATKAYKEMQDAVMTMMVKKCGPEPKNETAASPQIMFSESQFKLREWLQAYFAVLAEKGPAAAAEIVLASDEEVKLIESRMTQLKQLIATEAKLFKKS